MKNWQLRKIELKFCKVSPFNLLPTSTTFSLSNRPLRATFAGDNGHMLIPDQSAPLCSWRILGNSNRSPTCFAHQQSLGQVNQGSPYPFNSHCTEWLNSADGPVSLTFSCRTGLPQMRGCRTQTAWGGRGGRCSLFVARLEIFEGNGKN